MPAFKSQLHPSEVAFVVDCVFQCAHIQGRKISDCNRLSEKLANRVGVSISASTLYRMVNAKKYNIRPYDFTMHALYEFCGVKSHQQLLEKFRFVHHGQHFVEYPESFGLESLLKQQLDLRRFSEIRSFLSRLPGGYDAYLLGERHTIGRTLGHYFRNMDDPTQRRDLINFFLEEDHFFIYFFETFPDLDYTQHYFFTALQDAIRIKGFIPMLENILHVGKEQEAVIQIERAVYACSLYLHLAYQLGKKEEIKTVGARIFPSMKHFVKLEDLISSNNIVLARLYNAYTYFLCIQRAALKFSFEKQMELLGGIMRNTIHPWGKIFTHTVIFDTWQMLDAPWKEARFDFKDDILQKEARLQSHVEPFMHRYLAYYGEKPPLLNNKPDHFQMGTYEIETSKMLIQGIFSN